MKKAAAILAALALGVVTAAAGIAPAPSGKGLAPMPPMDPCASPVSYNDVELLYAYTDFDNSRLFFGRRKRTGDGARLNFEYSPLQNVYFTVSGSYDSVDNFDLWSVSGGIGGYVPLTGTIHLAADAGFTYTRRDDGFGYVSAKGWYMRPHIRAKLGCLEAHAGAQYTDRHNGGDLSLFAQLYYQVAPGWDLTLGVVDNNSATTLLAGGITLVGGVRFRF